MELWSNPGDLVFSPFTGIGSEGYVAIEMGRKFVGAELKRSYFELAVRNLGEARTHKDADLFATSEPHQVGLSDADSRRIPLVSGTTDKEFSDSTEHDFANTCTE